MRRGRYWVFVLGLAPACSLPALDEFAQPGVDAGTNDGGLDAVADASVVEASTSGPEITLEPPVLDDLAIDLSAAGGVDWWYWAAPAVHCASCSGAVLGPIASAVSLQRYSDDARTFSWSNGTPTATGASRAGVFVAQESSALEMRAGLPAAAVRLTLHVGVYHAAAALELALEGTSMALPSVSVPVGQEPYRIVVHAKAPGMSLLLRWRMAGTDGTSASNITASAATVALE